MADRFLVNSATQEIHDGLNLHERCNVDDARKAEHIQAVGVREFKMLILEHFDLCGWCFGEMA